MGAGSAGAAGTAVGDREVDQDRRIEEGRVDDRMRVVVAHRSPLEAEEGASCAVGVAGF